MNDAAREVLVAAALRGHRQITHFWHDINADEGECAQGVLHLTMHQNRKEAVKCGETMGNCGNKMLIQYNIDHDAWWDIAGRNDAGQDFLTIARKAGTDA